MRRRAHRGAAFNATCLVAMKIAVLYHAAAAAAVSIHSDQHIAVVKQLGRISGRSICLEQAPKRISRQAHTVGRGDQPVLNIVAVGCDPVRGRLPLASYVNGAGPALLYWFSPLTA